MSGHNEMAQTSSSSFFSVYHNQQEYLMNDLQKNWAEAAQQVSPLKLYEVIIAQWLAWQLATGEVPGSNPGEGENLINF